MLSECLYRDEATLIIIPEGILVLEKWCALILYN